MIFYPSSNWAVFLTNCKVYQYIHITVLILQGDSLVRSSLLSDNQFKPSILPQGS